MNENNIEKRWNTYQNQVKGMLVHSGRGSVAMAAVTSAVLVDVNHEAEATIITGTNFSVADMTFTQSSRWNITGAFESGASTVTKSQALVAFDGLVQWKMNTNASSSDAALGFDIGSIGWAFVIGTGASTYGKNGGTVIFLDEGATIGSSSVSGSFAIWNALTAEQSGYIGVRFRDSNLNTFYGWIEAEVSEDGSTLSLISWAYDDSGASIIAGAVPEPTAMALLAMGAVGVGAYRRRKKNG